jgi:hypothetical protein
MRGAFEDGHRLAAGRSNPVALNAELLSAEALALVPFPRQSGRC